MKAHTEDVGAPPTAGEMADMRQTRRTKTGSFRFKLPQLGTKRQHYSLPSEGDYVFEKYDFKRCAANRQQHYGKTESKNLAIMRRMVQNE